jgi:hypothetical protein
MIKCPYHAPVQQVQAATSGALDKLHYQRRATRAGTAEAVHLHQFRWRSLVQRRVTL